MSSFRFVCLGCGDAFSELWYSSCLAIQASGRTLLIDCPHPIRKILRESAGAAGVSLDLDRIDGVILTHLHADHASGIEGFAFYAYYLLGRRIPLLAHPLVSGPLWEERLEMTMGEADGRFPGDPNARTVDLGHYLELRALSIREPVRLGPFSIECRPTIHPIPTFALRIKADGRTLGYSGDTSFDPSLIDWLAPSDLIVHETNRGIHTAYEALAGLPSELRSRMRLIHYPDDFRLDESVIEPLRQGGLYEV